MYCTMWIYLGFFVPYYLYTTLKFLHHILSPPILYSVLLFFLFMPRAPTIPHFFFFILCFPFLFMISLCSLFFLYTYVQTLSLNLYPTCCLHVLEGMLQLHSRPESNR
uniref:Uncharacterized protein n=1 Tax=Cacopsylla melanoneura TaxID=428564 RepID=A0A8D9FJH2_9HEMI